MDIERRQNKRHPSTYKVGIFLARGEHGSAQSATLAGNLVDISAKGATLSLPEILDGQNHLAYTAMGSSSLILHVKLTHHNGQELLLPAKPIWFNRSLSEHLTPFKLGIEFITPLSKEQLAPFL